MPKPERINFRISPADREKLKQVCELTGLDEPTALRACVVAFIEHVEEHGGIWLPLAILPKDQVPPKSQPLAPAAARNAAGAPATDSTRFSTSDPTPDELAHPTTHPKKPTTYKRKSSS